MLCIVCWQASMFNKQAKTAKNKMWWKNMKVCCGRAPHHPPAIHHPPLGNRIAAQPLATPRSPGARYSPPQRAAAHRSASWRRRPS